MLCEAAALDYRRLRQEPRFTDKDEGRFDPEEARIEASQPDPKTYNHKNSPNYFLQKAIVSNEALFRSLAQCSEYQDDWGKK